MLMRLAKEPGIRLVGIDYKEPTPEAGQRFLTRHGVPFSAVGADAGGRAAIDFGVYGVPETFIIDAGGRIRYKHVGPIMPRDLIKTILPIIGELRQ